MSQILLTFNAKNLEKMFSDKAQADLKEKAKEDNKGKMLFHSRFFSL
jgi:hypothetical protein